MFNINVCFEKWKRFSWMVKILKWVLEVVYLVVPFYNFRPPYFLCWGLLVFSATQEEGSVAGLYHLGRWRKTVFECSSSERKNRVIFDLKSLVTRRTKIRPRIPSNWRIFEDIESQLNDSILRVSSILVPLMTQLFRSKWLHFSFQLGNGLKAIFWLELDAFLEP